MSKMVIEKGSQSADWGTPVEPVEVMRRTVGPIDFDMASSETHNRIIHAKDFRTKQNPYRPCIVTRIGTVVWCNPPGPVAVSRWFWHQWCNLIDLGAKGGFLIFQIDYWRSFLAPSFKCWCVIWPARLRYTGAQSTAHFSSVLVLTSCPSNDDLPPDTNVVEWRKRI
jgi:hypothetical protein